MFAIVNLAGRPAGAIEVFDVGGMPEGVPRYAPLLDQDLANVTAFEPQVEEARQLEATQGRTRCLPIALGDGRQHTLHITRYPGCSSLYEPDPVVIDSFFGIGAADRGGNFHVDRTIRLGTRQLDAIPNLPEPDWIKLDIQGGELQALAHGTRCLSHAVVVEVEVEFVPLYRGQPLFGDVQRFMAQHGFWLHRLENLQGRCYRPFAVDDPAAGLSQPLWCDAVFVRDPSRLTNWTDDDLHHGAVILHECYGSYDLALRLLTARDERRRTAVAASYVSALKAAHPISARYTR